MGSASRGGREGGAEGVFCLFVCLLVATWGFDMVLVVVVVDGVGVGKWFGGAWLHVFLFLFFARS